jgi:hypothetical protein
MTNIFRKILHLAPFFAGPIYGVVPLELPVLRQYLYNYSLFLLLFGSWHGVLWAISAFSKDTATYSKTWKSLRIVSLMVFGFLVIAASELSRTTLKLPFVALMLALLVAATWYRRTRVQRAVEQEILAALVYAFGMALASIILGSMQWDLDPSVIIGAIAIAAITNVDRVAELIYIAGKEFFSTSEVKVTAKKGKPKRELNADAVPRISKTLHPRSYVRLYTAMLLLGPIALSVLVYMRVLAPLNLLALISILLMRDTLDQLSRLKHTGSIPPTLLPKTVNFSILLLCLTVVSTIF